MSNVPHNHHEPLTTIILRPGEATEWGMAANDNRKVQPIWYKRPNLWLAVGVAAAVIAWVYG